MREALSNWEAVVLSAPRDSRNPCWDYKEDVVFTVCCVGEGLGSCGETGSALDQVWEGSDQDGLPVGRGSVLSSRKLADGPLRGHPGVGRQASIPPPLLSAPLG